MKRTKIKGGYFHNGKGKQFTVLQDALANDTKCGCGINCKDGFISLPSFDSVTGDKEGFHGFYFVDGELVTDTVPNIKEEIKSFCNGPQEPQALRLTFDSIENANTLVGDASNVADWNAFFDLPTYGTPFSAVTISGSTIQLFGGSNITLKDELFDRPDDLGFHLLEIEDSALCVVAAGYDCFGYDNYNGCPNLTTAIFPAMVTAGDHCFSTSPSSLVNVDFSSLTTAGIGCFQNVPFVDPDFPVLSPILPRNLFNNCVNLTDSFSLLSRVTEAGNYCFTNCVGFINLNLPLLITAGNYCFESCYSLTTINIPSCTDLGGTVGDDFVFSGINGNTITLTVSPGLMTCNSGSPDGDIQYLQANNTVTIITV